MSNEMKRPIVGREQESARVRSAYNSAQIWEKDEISNYNLSRWIFWANLARLQFPGCIERFVLWIVTRFYPVPLRWRFGGHLTPTLFVGGPGQQRSSCYNTSVFSFHSHFEALRIVRRGRESAAEHKHTYQEIGCSLSSGKPYINLISIVAKFVHFFLVASLAYFRIILDIVFVVYFCELASNLDAFKKLDNFSSIFPYEAACIASNAIWTISPAIPCSPIRY